MARLNTRVVNGLVNSHAWNNSAVGNKLLTPFSLSSLEVSGVCEHWFHQRPPVNPTSRKNKRVICLRKEGLPINPELARNFGSRSE